METTVYTTGLYIDGDKTLVIKFADQPDFLRQGKVIMDEIKEECSRIIAECPDPNNLTANNVQAIRVWLDHVDAMVEVRRPVIPSVLSARNNFVEAIGDQ
eukprot:scaffold642300_cov59-Attheya_sp.AAC.1